MKEENVHYDCTMCIHYNNGQCKQINCTPNEILDFSKTNWRSLFTLKKEETIEEAALKRFELYKQLYKMDDIKQLYFNAFITGSNWQKEQSESIRISREKEYLDHIDKRYTEAEVIKLLVQHTAYVLENNTYSIDSEEWFNENKKK
jgi:hypothetical protein